MSTLDFTLGVLNMKVNNTTNGNCIEYNNKADIEVVVVFNISFKLCNKCKMIFIYEALTK